MSPALLILAAGLGTRYGGLKQLDPVGPLGEALLDYAIADARRAGFGPAVVVVRADIADAVRRHLDRFVPGHPRPRLVVQELDDLPGGRPRPAERSAPWGTAHAVWAARRALDRPFVVANADDHYGAEAYEALAAHLAEAGGTRAWGLATYRLGEVLSSHGPVNRGLCRVDGAGWLEDVVEGRDLRRAADGRVEGRTLEEGPVRLPGDTPVSTNLWAFTRSALEFLERELDLFLDGRGGSDPGAECLLPDVIRRGLRNGSCRVRARPVNATFFGVTHPEDRPEVVRRLAERGPAWEGADPSRGP